MVSHTPSSRAKKAAVFTTGKTTAKKVTKSTIKPTTTAARTPLPHNRDRAGLLLRRTPSQIHSLEMRRRAAIINPSKRSDESRMRWALAQAKIKPDREAIEKQREKKKRERDEELREERDEKDREKREKRLRERTPWLWIGREGR